MVSVAPGGVAPRAAQAQVVAPVATARAVAMAAAALGAATAGWVVAVALGEGPPAAPRLRVREETARRAEMAGTAPRRGRRVCPPDLAAREAREDPVGTSRGAGAVETGG